MKTRTIILAWVVVLLINALAIANLPVTNVNDEINEETVMFISYEQ